MPTKKPQNAAASQPTPDSGTEQVGAVRIDEPVTEPAAEAKPAPRKLSLSEVMSQFGAAPKAVLKTITFTDKTDESEVTADVWVRRLSYEGAQKIAKAYQFETGEDGQSTLTGVDGALMQRERIAQTICSDQDGALLFKGESQVAGLDDGFARALYVASDEVNNYAGKSKTAS